MRTLRISDNEVAVIAEDGSLNGSIRKSGTCITFNNLQDAKQAWELLTNDALEYREPEPAMHLADLEILSQRIDSLESTLGTAQCHDASIDRDLADELEQVKAEQMELRQELEGVQNMAMCEAEVNDMIEEAVEEHQHSDNLDEDHIHDLVATYIMDDTAGTLQRKVVGIVADKLLGR